MFKQRDWVMPLVSTTTTAGSVYSPDQWMLSDTVIMTEKDTVLCLFPESTATAILEFKTCCALVSHKNSYQLGLFLELTPQPTTVFVPLTKNSTLVSAIENPLIKHTMVFLDPNEVADYNRFGYFVADNNNDTPAAQRMTPCSDKKEFIENIFFKEPTTPAAATDLTPPPPPPPLPMSTLILKPRPDNFNNNHHQTTDEEEEEEQNVTDEENKENIKPSMMDE
jgi:hypothetical protein